MHKTSEIDRQPLTEAEANANGWAAPAQRTQNGLYTEEEAIEIGYQFLADVVGTVSYTHLDVYKRQLPACPFQSISEEH